MIYLTCPHCDDESEYVDAGSFVTDAKGALSFTSDDTVQGKHLDGKSTIKCETCGRTLRAPKVSFA